MENAITRLVAALCAAGSAGLFWTLGVFVAVPWHERRIFALEPIEIQLIAVPLLLGSVAAWGALHILAIADRSTRTVIYTLLRALFVAALLAAAASGVEWTQAHGVASPSVGSQR